METLLHSQGMPTHSDDRILWILVGLGIFIAAKAIPANLQYVRQLTRVKIEDESTRGNQVDVEYALKTETLQKLAAGRNYEIRSTATKIIAERCISGAALILLLEDLKGGDPERRDKAINALKLFVSHRSVQDSEKLFLLTTGQAFHAIVTALVNLLPQHGDVYRDAAGDSEGKVRCYQMDYSLPVMSRSRYESYMKRVERMTMDCAGIPNERAILCKIPAQQKQLLALTGLTPLTEYYLNKNAPSLLLEDEISVVALDRVPDITDEFRHFLSNIYSNNEETGGLTGWRLKVTAADRLGHVESLLKALWSSGSLAVQASSLKTSITIEQDALENQLGRDIYDAFCRERAAYFRQLTGGTFQQALQSANEGSVMIGGKAGSSTSDMNVLLPSPVRPPYRPPQERSLLFILRKLLYLNTDNVEMALGVGLVSRWLLRYPFPCMLTPSKQHDVVAFLREKAWGTDDFVMAELMQILTSVEKGREQLCEYGLTKITNFHAYWHGGDLYGQPPSARPHDVVMTGGEDTAGILPSTTPNGWDQRPGSSWSRSHPDFGSLEAIQRRRRREAMVLSDGDEPLTEGNILQRENSRVALVPGQTPDVEERLAHLIGAIERRDGDEDAEDQRAANRAAQGSPQRLPLADITGLGSLASPVGNTQRR